MGMMTDLDRMKNLFDELHIPYEVFFREVTIYAIFSEPRQTLRVNNGIGYSEFYVDYYFDKETEKFVGHGVWE